MAMSNESPLENKFRQLVHDIAMELTLHNCSSLEFLYKIKKHTWEPYMPGLEIMKELMSRNYFTHLKPDNLKSLLTRIQREDLISLVSRYKESEEFKLSQKRDSNKKERKQRKSKQFEKHDSIQSLADTSDKDHCGHMASVALMQAAQTVGQTRYFLELITSGSEQKFKKEVARVSKDFEKLLKSLNKAITATKDLYSTTDQATHKIKGNQINNKKRSDSELSNSSTLESRQSTTPTESISSSSTSVSSTSLAQSTNSFSSKSEDDQARINIASRQDLKDTEEEKIMEDSCTGDTGYDGSPLDFSKPPASLKAAEKNDLPDEPDYDELMPIQETQHRKYKALTLDTKDEPHQYAKYKSVSPS